MSRAYRLRVRESLRRLVRTGDHVESELELLDILPAAEMAGLLADELARHGFQRRGERLSRSRGGVSVSVQPATGSVRVASQLDEAVEVTAERQVVLTDRTSRHAREQVRKSLRKTLKQDLKKEADRLQEQATDRVEAELAGLRRELDQVVNRVTAEALKRKAARIGQIKELSEDPESGSLTIVVEV